MVLTYDSPLYGVSIQWHGGAYIEIVHHGVVIEAWNVWDYAEDCATIAFNGTSFLNYITKRLSDKLTVEYLVEAIRANEPKRWVMAN